MKHIEFKSIAKSFGNNHVFKDSSLKIEPYESVVFLGPSGAGKSVLLKCLLGFVNIDKGKIIYDGKEVQNLRGKEWVKHLKKFGVLFQGSALFDSLSVIDNIMFGLKEGENRPLKHCMDKALEAIDLVGLDSAVAGVFPKDLSGGMQKRVALARALVLDPEVLIFDEPTTGLDPITAKKISNLMLKCHRERNLTLLTITHDMPCAEMLSTRIVFVDKPDITWSGTFQEALNTPKMSIFIKGIDVSRNKI
jgi:phospholipid/cholesterol/gamma-HCH transport system ATP-binding protein